MQLEGKAAIVTGSSSGIGSAAALALANAGADVVVNGNTKMEAAEEVAHQIEGLGRKSLAVQADVSDPDATASLIFDVNQTIRDGRKGSLAVVNAHRERRQLCPQHRT